MHIVFDNELPGIFHRADTSLRRQQDFRWPDRVGNEPSLRWKLPFQFFLPLYRRHGVVDTQHLMITGHNLARPTRLAVVEENKIFDEVEETIMGQHTVEQYLGVNIASVCLVIALPLAKMLPLTGDGAVARSVAVADHQKGIVVESMGNAVFVQI